MYFYSIAILLKNIKYAINYLALMYKEYARYTNCKNQKICEMQYQQSSPGRISFPSTTNRIRYLKRPKTLPPLHNSMKNYQVGSVMVYYTENMIIAYMQRNKLYFMISDNPVDRETMILLQLYKLVLDTDSNNYPDFPVLLVVLRIMNPIIFSIVKSVKSMTGPEV
jgi:hypothetical protein